MTCSPDRTLEAARFRALIQMHGQAVRYWRALPCPCSDPQSATFSRTCQYHDKYGFIYEEMTLPTNYKAYIYNSRSSVLHPELGWIKVANVKVASMPPAKAAPSNERIYYDRGDKLLSVNARLVQRETRKRETTGDDNLSQLFVSVIDALVVQGATVYVLDTDYKLVVNATTGASSIQWIGAAPTAGTIYSIIYRYAPMYWVIGENANHPRPSATGDPLVLFSDLSMKHPSEAG